MDERTEETVVMSVGQFLTCLFAVVLGFIGCCVPLAAAWAESHIPWLAPIPKADGTMVNGYLVFSQVLLIVLILATGIGILINAFSDE